MTTLLGISGSLRADSTNTKLMRNAARLFAADTFVEGDLRLPLYDGDLEAASGIPAPVQKLADQIAAADAVIIATPEYNKAIPGVLKNALDWVSRTAGKPWEDKPLAIMSATAGRAGGERTQFSLRHAMFTFSPRIIHQPEVLVAQSAAQFDDDGLLINAQNLKGLTAQMEKLRSMI